MSVFRSQLDEISRKVQHLKDEYDELVEMEQKSCKHPTNEILEGQYQLNQYLDSVPPFRVCKLCGYSEEGWGCGYKKLYSKTEIPTVGRKNGFSYILGQMRKQPIS